MIALGMKRPLTEAEKRALLARYLAGEKIEVIAAAYGVDRGYPGRLARARNLPRRPRRPTRIEQEAVT